MIQMHTLRIFPAKFATSYAHIRIDGRGADQFLKYQAFVDHPSQIHTISSIHSFV